MKKEKLVTEPPAFPSKQAHADAWNELASAIAANGDNIEEAAPNELPANPGELIIIGSGIESVGFTVGDEDLIRSADEVFYCVADPATVVWLKSIRPDAYDLYVLYDDSKVRYTTYMQMSEAMLHYVRQGRRVVAIYYGHPGIFVLSTHRAIMIARREGHRAIMRPSVCALDCLCADLGVDPCHPGLQTHEATDMLIRGRVPDTSLHVVLWQVGLIGEMGFRRKGYLNENFSIFIEYLQKYYGDDYPLTHYVASRYPSVDPLIEVYPLSALHDPTIQSRVTGISTFYLAPKETAEANVDMLIRLGMVKPGQPLRVPEGPLREIGKYGPRERKAFSAFNHFRIPKGYHWQEDTAASRFLIALQHRLDLRQRYASNPKAAVSPESFPGLTDRERKLLATRDPGAIQIAAKGLGVSNPENRALLTELYQKKAAQTGLLRRLRTISTDKLKATLESWSKSNGHMADWSSMQTDIDLMQRDSLFMWTGIYSSQSSEEGLPDPSDHLIVLTGDGEKARLSVDGIPVRRFAFGRGVLQWRARAGQYDNGYLRVDVDSHGRRRLIGAIWPEDQPIPTTYKFIAKEVSVGRQHPASLVGNYVRDVNDQREELEITVIDEPALGRRLVAYLNGKLLDGSLSLQGRTLNVGSQSFLVDLPTVNTVKVATSRDNDSEPSWKCVNRVPSALCGIYKVWMQGGGRWQLEVAPDGIRINGTTPATVEVAPGHISWTGGPDKASSGKAIIVLDPISLYPGMFGTATTTAGISVRCHGVIPPPVDLRRYGPEFGLTRSLWDKLVALTTRPNNSSGLMLWHQAEKASLATYIINAVFVKHL